MLASFLESQLAGKNRNDYDSEYGKNPSKPHTVGGACHAQGNPTMKLSSIFADTSKAKHFPAGTTIFEKGDRGEDMYYVVKEGEVDIVINDFHFETVSPDGFFGELSLIDQEKRIASAIARTDCTLQVIDKRHFLFSFRKPLSSLSRS
jgi:CRP/FNR family transcriptional regulator, cyclic AMP receptor protein